ncbi:unnamed protein product [Arctogadus glacialis]
MAGHRGRSQDQPTKSKGGSEKDTDILFILNHPSVTSSHGLRHNGGREYSRPFIAVPASGLIHKPLSLEVLGSLTDHTHLQHMWPQL